jgi:phage gp36-like protein
MSYATTTGIDAKFGSVNVTTWADLNNNANAGEIAARKAAAIVYADAEVDARLRDTHYRRPLATSAGATPAAIADVANALAGCWLKDPRGQETFDEHGSPVDSLSYHRTKAYQTLAEIRSGVVRLDAV